MCVFIFIFNPSILQGKPRAPRCCISITSHEITPARNNILWWLIKVRFKFPVFCQFGSPDVIGEDRWEIPQYHCAVVPLDQFEIERVAFFSAPYQSKRAFT